MCGLQILADEPLGIRPRPKAKAIVGEQNKTSHPIKTHWGAWFGRKQDVSFGYREIVGLAGHVTHVIVADAIALEIFDHFASSWQNLHAPLSAHHQTHKHYRRSSRSPVGA